MTFSHTPVLLKEVIESLNVWEGKRYIDGTLGGGGYSFEILKRGGKVLGIDLDNDAIEWVRREFKVKSSPLRQGFVGQAKFKIKEEDFVLIQGNFKDIEKIARSHNFFPVAGIVFDLGLSSYQIEGSGRGFSFMRDEPLDMRMSNESKLTAADIINSYSEQDLCEVFLKGEEHFAREIASKIVERRKQKKFETTGELVELIVKNKHGSGATHPATKIFQALRMEVNNELDNLKIALPKAFELLESKGRLVVVSFHSLEDRIVKRLFRELMQEGYAIGITRKPIKAQDVEINQNIRARSGKMRVIERA